MVRIPAYSRYGLKRATSGRDVRVKPPTSSVAIVPHSRMRLRFTMDQSPRRFSLRRSLSAVPSSSQPFGSLVLFEEELAGLGTFMSGLSSEIRSNVN